MVDDKKGLVVVCLNKVWFFGIDEWNNVCRVYMMGVVIIWGVDCSFKFSKYVWWFYWV